MIIDLILRGKSLYKSARKGQVIWFVALLIVNSLGILPVIYLLIESSTSRTQKTNATPKKNISVSKKRKGQSK